MQSQPKIKIMLVPPVFDLTGVLYAKKKFGYAGKCQACIHTKERQCEDIVKISPTQETVVKLNQTL